MRRVAIAALLACAASAPAVAQSPPIAVRDGDGWRGLWRPDSIAPAQWPRGDVALRESLNWQRGRDGVSWAELPLRGDGEAWRTRAIIVRIDPSRVRIRLDTAFTRVRDAHGAVMRRAAWHIGQAARPAILAVNAGQFAATVLGTLPWGWVVLEGREWRPPGIGPLSTAIVIDSGGGVRLLSPNALESPLRMRGVRFAFQSFPSLLEGDGDVPTPLQAGTGAVDRTHRDARLALGTLRDGSMLLVMTRFDVFGRVLGAVPFGLTTPEMAALMGALGCARAVMLDGGISAQMQLRTAAGALQRWPGWRSVPLGLVIEPR